MSVAQIRTDSRPDDMITQRAQKGLDLTDAMPEPHRQCVYEFGFAIVHAFREAGINDARIIRHLVNEVWNGGRQPAQRLGNRNRVGNVMAKLDWLLVQSGSPITAATLVRLLWSNGMAIVPREPSPTMVNASVDATGHMGLVSKTEKHRSRLRAAIEAAVTQYWPHLLDKPR